jgi:hypothetical protein
MKRGAWLLALGLLALPLHAQSNGATQGFHYRFSGYYRTLFSTSHSLFTGDPYADSLNRVRLSFDGHWNHSVLIHIDYDNQANFGNLITQPDFDFVRNRLDNTYFDLFHIWVNEPHVYWDTSLYRGYLVLRHGGAELTLGRQRIAWGTAHFWSPADVFNPISPLQVEADEREGVDAAQLACRLPHGLRWSLVYAPQDRFNQSTEATRIATTFHNFDVAAFAGRFQRNWVGGATFDGQWNGAGLRGETTYTWSGTPTQPNALRLTFGSDYQLNPKLYLVGEYFYNHAQPIGVNPNQPFTAAELLRFTNGIFTLDRHFASVGLRCASTPLFHVAGYAVGDVTGPGIFFMPQATYSLSNNSELTLGGELFGSSSQGDFSQLRNLVYVEFTVHF